MKIMRSNFFSTHIRHFFFLLPLALAVGILVIGVVAPAFLALLVPGIGCSTNPCLADLLADIGAVFLPAIIWPADEEDLATIAATQLQERNLLVHPTSGMDKKLDVNAASEQTPGVGYSFHPKMYPEGAGSYLRPHFFPSFRSLYVGR